MMLSSAPTRHTRSVGERAQGAALAMLVQAAFIAMVFLSAQQPQPLRNLARETILFLHPTPKPSRIDARGPLERPVAIPATPRIAPPPDNAAPLSLAPPGGIAGFGRSLFGCAPEHYADLPPDERAHCPKPGEGMAINQPPDLMGGPSHVKDNPRWANAMAHKQPLPMLPGGMLFPLVALGAVLDGSISEPSSAFRDPEQWPDERDPQQFMPHSLHEQERIYDAWRKDHPVPPAASK